jgi:hypothetical protein
MGFGSMGFTKPDQLICGRIRLSAQASIRNDDLRRTPSGRIEWVYDPFEGEHREYRGILTRAQHTKTLPRHWACSRLGVTEQGDGWLEATVGLLAMAHGDGSLQTTIWENGLAFERRRGAVSTRRAERYVLHPPTDARV